MFNSSGSLGMGISFALYDNFTGAARGIGASMRGLEGATDSMMAKVAASQNMIGAGTKMMAAGLTALAPIGAGLAIAAQFEQAEIALSTLLKSTAAGKAVFETVKADAKATPFGTEEILRGNIALISTGINAKEARATILDLANAVAGAGKGSEELTRMTANLQQIKNLGVASAVDIKQFGYAGINIYKLLADATGKTQKQVRDMEITYDLLTLALKRAGQEGGLYYKALENQSKSIMGKWSTFEDGIKFTLAGVGKALFDIAHPALDWAIKMTDKVSAFIETDLGKQFVGWAAGVGIFLVVGGAALVLLGALRLAAIQASIAFVGMLLPALPYLAAALAVGLAIYGIYSKWKDVFTGIYQIWTSFNRSTGTFTLSEDLAQALEQKGLLNFVLSLGTWLIRIKTFLAGVKAGFIEAWDAGVKGLKSLWEILQPVRNFIVDLFPALAKNTSELQKWFTIGKYVGYGLVIVLGLVTAGLAAAAAMAAIAFSAVFIGFGIAAGLAWLLWKAIKAVGDMFVWLWEQGNAAFDAGVGFVKSLMEGISSMWDTFLAWITAKIQGIPLVGNFIGKFLGADNNTERAPVTRPVIDRSNALGNNTAQLRAASNPQPVVFDKTTSTVKNITVQTNLDGRSIAERMLEISNQDHHRTSDQ